jgi:hypothetical protein
MVEQRTTLSCDGMDSKLNLVVLFVAMINRVRFEVEHVNSLHASIQNVVNMTAISVRSRALILKAKRMKSLVKCIPTERVRARK